MKEVQPWATGDWKLLTSYKKNLINRELKKVTPLRYLRYFFLILILMNLIHFFHFLGKFSETESKTLSYPFRAILFNWILYSIFYKFSIIKRKKMNLADKYVSLAVSAFLLLLKDSFNECGLKISIIHTDLRTQRIIKTAAPLNI